MKLDYIDGRISMCIELHVNQSSIK